MKAGYRRNEVMIFLLSLGEKVEQNEMRTEKEEGE